MPCDCCVQMLKQHLLVTEDRNMSKYLCAKLPGPSSFTRLQSSQVNISVVVFLMLVSGLPPAHLACIDLHSSSGAADMCLLL